MQCLYLKILYPQTAVSVSKLIKPHSPSGCANFVGPRCKRGRIVRFLVWRDVLAADCIFFPNRSPARRFAVFFWGPTWQHPGRVLPALAWGYEDFYLIGLSWARLRAGIHAVRSSRWSALTGCFFAFWESLYYSKKCLMRTAYRKFTLCEYAMIRSPALTAWPKPPDVRTSSGG